jgi:ABC-type multidrug transport system ATPase subunit
VVSVLSLVGVSKRRGPRRVLAGVSLSLEAGETRVVMGPNGSGKSTLLAVAAGVLPPDAGRVVLEGTCGYAPSAPDIPDHVSAEEWLALVASLRGTKASARDELEALGLADVRARPVGTLSAGQRQRASLAAALLGSPSLLVLDEPEAALDDDGLTRLVRRLRGATCLVATHDATLAARLGGAVFAM